LKNCWKLAKPMKVNSNSVQRVRLKNSEATVGKRKKAP
jgi:hypothetical protein